MTWAVSYKHHSTVCFGWLLWVIYSCQYFQKCTSRTLWWGLQASVCCFLQKIDTYFYQHSSSKDFNVSFSAKVTRLLFPDAIVLYLIFSYLNVLCFQDGCLICSNRLVYFICIFIIKIQINFLWPTCCCEYTVVKFFSVFFVNREKGVNKKRTLCRFPKMLTIMNDPYLEYIYSCIYLSIYCNMLILGTKTTQDCEILPFSMKVGHKVKQLSCI